MTGEGWEDLEWLEGDLERSEVCEVFLYGLEDVVKAVLRLDYVNWKAGLGKSLVKLVMVYMHKKTGESLEVVIDSGAG